MLDKDHIASLIAFCVNYTGNMSIFPEKYYCSKVELNLTSCTMVQTPSDMETIHTLCDTSEIIWYAIFWFSMVTGIVGNSLAMITIASLPTSTATFYIGVLAFSDLLAIIIGMITFFLEKHRLLNPNKTYWHIIPLLFDFTASYSNWLLVLICLERLITIRYPFQKRYYFTIPHARITAIIMGLVLFAVYNIATWNLGYMDMRMYTIRNLLYAVIPLFLILALIVCIAISMRIIHKNRKELQERTSCINNSPITAINRAAIQNSLSNSEVTPLGKKQCSASLLTEIARMENSITIMMIVAAICFAFLTIPKCIHIFMYPYAVNLWNTPVARARWHVFSKTALALPFLNLAINFVLYFLSTKKFRTQLCKVLHLRGRQTQESSFPLNTYSLNVSITENCL